MDIIQSGQIHTCDSPNYCDNDATHNYAKSLHLEITGVNWLHAETLWIWKLETNLAMN